MILIVSMLDGENYIVIDDPGNVKWGISENAYWHIQEAANRVWGVQIPYRERTDVAVYVWTDFEKPGIYVGGIAGPKILIRYKDLDAIDRAANRCWGVWRESEKLKLYEWDGGLVLTSKLLSA